MEKTWKSVVAGVFCILGGATTLLFGLLFLGAGIFIQAVGGLFAGVNIVPGIIAIIVGAIAVLGGIQALKRKKWGSALTGSIFALFPNFPVGTIAIIFTVLSKNEFEQS